MTNFKDELEKILDRYDDWAYFCYNPNEFIDKYDEPPIEYPQIKAIQAIIELVDREIISEDEKPIDIHLTDKNTAIS